VVAHGGRREAGRRSATDPPRAERNPHRLLDEHPRGNAAPQLHRWHLLLRGPVDEIVDALTSRSARSVEQPVRLT